MEIKQSGKLWFHQVWQEAGWDGEKNVWRVEFQLRREILKEFSIYSVEDLWDKEDSLWAYLTKEWLLLKQPRGENVSRWPIKRKWTLIQNAGLNQDASPLVRERVRKGNSERLLNQAAGLIISIASLNNHEDINETARVLGEWTQMKLRQKNTTFQYKKETRRKRFVP